MQHLPRMQCPVFLLAVGLSLVLGSCANSIKILPGAPPPRISLNPAGATERQHLPKLKKYFQDAGYRVVRGGASEYDLNYALSDHGVYVDATMVWFDHGESSGMGEGRGYAEARYPDHNKVVEAALDEALDDLEAPTVRVVEPKKH